MTNLENKYKFELKKDDRNLELSCDYFEYFRENWPCDQDTALHYHFLAESCDLVMFIGKGSFMQYTIDPVPVR